MTQSCPWNAQVTNEKKISTQESFLIKTEILEQKHFQFPINLKFHTHVHNFHMNAALPEIAFLTLLFFFICYTSDNII